MEGEEKENTFRGNWSWLMDMARSLRERKRQHKDQYPTKEGEPVSDNNHGAISI